MSDYAKKRSARFLPVLVEAKRLIIEKGWTQHTAARNQEGLAVSPSAPEASSFCIIGALEVAADNVHISTGLGTRFLIDSCAEIMRIRTPRGYLAEFNDAEGRTKEEVVALFDKTIEKLKSNA